MRTRPASSQVSGPLLIDLDAYRDERGYFVERLRANIWAGLGLPSLVQDNHSRSAPSVLRGLHAQAEQGKLISCVRGAVYDVAVDLRRDSTTRGQHVAVTLSGEDPRWFWIPPGFAHGFYVLGSEPADVIYKVSAYYDPSLEFGIAWNHEDLGIAWPTHGQTPLLSEKDRALTPSAPLTQYFS